MKKIFLVGLVALLFASCKNRDDANTTNKDLLMLTDSSNASSYLTDTGVTATAPAEPNVVVQPAPQVIEKTTVIYRDNPNTGSSSNNSSASNNGSATTTTTQKQGISKAAKGAIIGGVGGAVGGAVIGKNAKGAAIGAAVGAAGGYIIGRGKDRKDGRVQ